jgi:hypothetical protein
VQSRAVKLPTRTPRAFTARALVACLLLLVANFSRVRDGLIGVPIYFGWKMAMVQPVGSWKTVIHPMLGISCGPMWMVAPRERARSVAC